MKIHTKTLLAAATTAALVGVSAQAAIVFSDDFESPDVTAAQSDGNTSGAIDTVKWQRSDEGFGSTRQGTVDEAHGDFTEIGDGEQAYAFRYTNSGITTKDGLLGAAVAGATFTVTFDVVVDGHNGPADVTGDPSLDPMPYTAALVTFNGGLRDRMNGGGIGQETTSILATTSGATLSTDYTQVTFFYTIDAIDDAAVIGHDVALRFHGASYTAIIDNVSVDAVVPEPGSLALMGLGGLMMLRRRRK